MPKSYAVATKASVWFHESAFHKRFMRPIVLIFGKSPRLRGISLPIEMVVVAAVASGSTAGPPSLALLSAILSPRRPRRPRENLARPA